MTQYRWFRARAEGVNSRVTHCFSTCYSDIMARFTWKSQRAMVHGVIVNARMLERFKGRRLSDVKAHAGESFGDEVKMAGVRIGPGEVVTGP